jgi:hypothetical protein
MTYLIIAALILLSIFLYLIIELKKSIHMIYIIPFTLFFVAGSYFYLDSIFGYPVLKGDEEKFYLVSYYIEENEEYFYLWIILKDEKIPKAIYVPYNKEDHRELERARRIMEGGGMVEGQFYNNVNGNKNGILSKEKSSSGQGSLKSKGGALSLFEIRPKSFLPPKDVN